ncbi:MAG: carboxypeptidase-like regulatory domain-containing protein [Planctomycetaceae bacterium]|jgi:hypothetical protein|nr:carboxypeptidase-like regulatory domain-containing protein [Planctomycetaceae bacterium]
MKITNIFCMIAVLPFFIIGTISISGCGSALESKYAELKLATVTGVVTFDGQPLANAQIQFVLADGFFSYGVTDSNGRYQMQFDTTHAGVKSGNCVVKIWTTMTGAGFNRLLPEDFKKPNKEIIPVQYNHNSTLSALVEAGKSQSFDFDLKSGGQAKKAISAEGDGETEY